MARDELYNILYTGKTHPKKSVEDVKSQAKALLKLTDAHVVKLFSGKPIALKKELTFEQAEKYHIKLNQIGMLVNMVESDPLPQQRIVNKAPSPLALAPMEKEVPEKETVEDAGALDSKFSDGKGFAWLGNILSPNNIIALLIFSLGVSLMLIFAPYPETIIKKGFLLGAAFSVFATRKVKI